MLLSRSLSGLPLARQSLRPTSRAHGYRNRYRNRDRDRDRDRDRLPPYSISIPTRLAPTPRGRLTHQQSKHSAPSSNLDLTERDMHNPPIPEKPCVKTCCRRSGSRSPRQRGSSASPVPRSPAFSTAAPRSRRRWRCVLKPGLAPSRVVARSCGSPNKWPTRSGRHASDRRRRLAGQRRVRRDRGFLRLAVRPDCPGGPCGSRGFAAAQSPAALPPAQGSGRQSREEAYRGRASARDKHDLHGLVAGAVGTRTTGY
jgi:hypothetical protein